MIQGFFYQVLSNQCWDIKPALASYVYGTFKSSPVEYQQKQSKLFKRLKEFDDILKGQEPSTNEITGPKQPTIEK